MGVRRAVTLLVLGITMVAPATAQAGIQFVQFANHSSTKTFRELRGTNQTSEADIVSVTETPGESGPQITINDSAGVSTFPADCQRLMPNSVACPLSDYDDVALGTGPGNDVITVLVPSYPSLTLRQLYGPNFAVFMNANLGAGNDRFVGGIGTDFALGGGGRDRLSGGGANDSLIGSGGNDVISGGPGKDDLFGDKGNDRLIAGPGPRDLMSGGRGKDSCIAHEGHDLVSHCERVRLR